MLTQLIINWITINVTHKFSWLQDASLEKISELVQSGFENKIDSYIARYTDSNVSEWHLSIVIIKNKSGNYDGNFQLSLWKHDIIYKREDFKDMVDLINHFFDHCKENFSDKKNKHH
jgi:hypothetical protein